MSELLDERLISCIAEEVMRQLKEKGYVILPEGSGKESQQIGSEREDITSAACKAKPLLKDPCDMDALLRMKGYTNARIGVGCVGPRLNTQTMLAMRADHAKARDSVFTDVSTYIRLYSVIIAFAFSVIVGIVFGYLPAKNAANLKPVDSIRYE